MVAETLTVAPPTALKAFWYSFRENRGAVIGAAIVGLIVLSAIFANILAPYSPLEQFREFTKLPPIWIWSKSMNNMPAAKTTPAKVNSPKAIQTAREAVESISVKKA